MDETQKEALDRAQMFMSLRMGADLSDHTLAMICYCFHLTGHSNARTALATILDRATQKAGYVQWLVEDRLVLVLFEMQKFNFEISKMVW